jgi:hypothetical protein
LGLLALSVPVLSFLVLRGESPRTEAGLRLEFRFEGSNPAHYSTITLEGDGVAQDPARAAQQNSRRTQSGRNSQFD